MLLHDEKQGEIEARVAAAMAEDNISEAATACWQYPQPPTDRAFSKFEEDLRDWGLIYGIAFGFAKVMQEDGEPNELVAERAYRVARARFAEWTGKIEDPTVACERAIRDVISKFEDAQERAYKAGRYMQIEGLMTEGLRDALAELEIVMGGQA